MIKMLHHFVLRLPICPEQYLAIKINPRQCSSLISSQAYLYILKAKSNFTLFIYMPFQDICE